MSSYCVGKYIRTRNADLLILPEESALGKLFSSKKPYVPTQHTRETVQKIVGQRYSFYQAVLARLAVPIEQATLTYLPGCRALNTAIINKPEMQPYMNISIEWSSGVIDPDDYSSESSMRSKSYCFELVMTEYVLAYVNCSLAHKNSGSFHNAKVFSEDFKIGAKHYRVAAGIFDFIASVQLPRFFLIPDERLPEMIPAFANALSSLCLAEAQAISILKARCTSSSTSVLSRLCLDAKNKYYTAKTLLESATTVLKYIDKDMKIYINFYYNYFFALTLRYAAEVHYQAAKYGLSVATIQLADTKFRALETKKCPEFGFKLIIEKDYPTVKDLLTKYKGENDSAYFDDVPTEQVVLDNLPAPHSLVAAERFEPPPLQFSHFEDLDKAGAEASSQ